MVFIAYSIIVPYSIGIWWRDMHQHFLLFAAESLCTWVLSCLWRIWIWIWCLVYYWFNLCISTFHFVQNGVFVIDLSAVTPSKATVLSWSPLYVQMCTTHEVQLRNCNKSIDCHAYTNFHRALKTNALHLSDAKRHTNIYFLAKI